MPQKLSATSLPTMQSFTPDAAVVTTDKLEARKDNSERKSMINQYLRLRKIGGGQHGEVYLCHVLGTEAGNCPPTEVAMKSVKRNNPRAEKYKELKMQRPQNNATPADPTNVADKLNTTEAKIKKEIAIMKKLRSPHVVRLYEVIDDRRREKIYMIMEYLGGGEVIWRDDNNNPTLTVSQTRRIIMDAVLGLDYLHTQGIIHRDIKPANLLYTADRSHVKIADFGVSHFSYAQRLSAAGEEGVKQDDPADPILLNEKDLSRRAGTPSFFAPEIIYEHTNEPDPPIASSSATSPKTSPNPGAVSSTPKPPITKAIDIWALGVTMYCLLFGEVPFKGENLNNEWSVYNAICNSDFTVPRTMGVERLPCPGRFPNRKDVSEGAMAVRLLDGLLQKDYTKRFTLDDIKMHPWILKDLPDKHLWIKIHNEPEEIDVSKDETSSAMSSVHFRWQLGKVAKRMTSFFKKPLMTRSPRNSIHRGKDGSVGDDGTGAVKSESNVSIERLNRGNDVGLTAKDIRNAKAKKGKQREKEKERRKLEQGKRKSTKSLRSKSADRWTTTTRGGQQRGHETNCATIRDTVSMASMKTPMDAGTPVVDKGKEKEKPRRGLWNFPSRAPSVANSSEVCTPVSAKTMPMPQKTDIKSHYSEEMLRFKPSAEMILLSENPELTIARRASSWGHGDGDCDDMEFAEVESMFSDQPDPLDDLELAVGAGGVERTSAAVSRTPEMPTVSAEAGPSTLTSRSGFIRDEEERSFVDADSFLSSSVASSSSSLAAEQGASRWQDGSSFDLDGDEVDEEEDDDDDDEDGDDDDDENDGPLIFATPRHAHHRNL